MGRGKDVTIVSMHFLIYRKYRSYFYSLQPFHDVSSGQIIVTAILAYKALPILT